MTERDEELERELRAWSLEPPAPDLAQRIARRATGHPQAHPWHLRARAVLARFFSEWRYGFALKAGGLALCALAGVMAGHLAGAGGESDVVALAFGANGWESGL